MRNLITITSRTTFVLATAVLAMAMLGFVGDASAGTKQLVNKHSSGAVAVACGEAGGTYTTTSAGGYGCKTSKGEVKCNKDKTCTGTCAACGKRLIGPFLKGVLGRPSTATSRATQ